MDTKPRHPSEISGRIRHIAENLQTRRDRISNREDCSIADQFDAGRIIELLTELDAALLTMQLEASVKEKP